MIPPLVLPTQASLKKQLFIAYSGGKDSTVLLHKLSQQLLDSPVKITAIHINHQLSSQADQWQKHCQHFCEALGVKFHPIAVEVVNKTREGLEKRARDARLAAFSHFLPTQAFLAMAHHQQDQAETVLLKLLRGGGLGALSGMQETTPYNHFFLWRPMLSRKKTEVEEYAIKNELDWVEDDSNENVQLRRNYLRKKILPQIEQTWQGASKLLANNAQQAQREDKALNYFLQQTFAAVLLTPSPFAMQSISKEALLSFPQDVIFLLIKYWLKTHRITLLQSYLQEILRQATTANSAEFIMNVKSGKYVLCVRQNELSLYPFIEAKEITQERIEANVFDIKDKGIQHQWLLERPLSIRCRAGEERITIKQKSLRLKRWYKQNKLPRCWRQLPLIYAGEEVIGVVGLTLFDYPEGKEKH